MKNLARALCLTPACVQLGAELAKNLSPNYKQLDPCNDFHEMVCGGFPARYPLEPGESSVNTIGLLAQKSFDTVRAVIEGPYPGLSAHSSYSPQSLHKRDASLADVDQENFDMMKMAYTSCMDEKAIADAGAQPITQLLEQLITTFSPNTSDWSAQIIFLRQIGITVFASPAVLYAPTTGDPYLNVAADTSSFLERATNYENATLVREYTEVVADLLDKISPRKFNSTLGTAEGVVEFERKLYHIDSTYSSSVNLTLSELKNHAPELNIDKVIRGLAPGDWKSDPDSVSVQLGNNDALTKISSLISETPNEIVEAYLIAKTILKTEPLVVAPDVFARLHKLLPMIRNSSPEDSPPPVDRTDVCMDYTVDRLGWIVSRFFIEHAFSAHGKEVADQIIHSIRAVYISRFNTLDWMDDATKAEAIKKVEKMAQNIGYPTDDPLNLTDPLSLRAFYAGVTITPSHFANQLSLRNSTSRREWAALTSPVNQLTEQSWPWYFTPLTVDAIYSSLANVMTFPAGILQSPFFHEDLPPAINYGAFGAVAGHEVSHAFDTRGRTFDSEGNVSDWWGNETLAEYNRRVGCFVEQFDGFTVSPSGGGGTDKLQVNGTLTLAENLADSAGLVASFEAWKRAVEERPGGLQNLPGLEGIFSPEQLFFVGYANVWCHNTNLRGLEREVQSLHAPPDARIRGTLANSRAFKEAFGCKVREPTCELW